MWDVDNFIRRVKTQRAFGIPRGDQPTCQTCGTFVATYWTNADEPIYEALCAPCFMRAVAAPTTPTKKKSKHLCRYCWKPRKLVGAWCRTCRNHQQRLYIKAALSKVKSGQALTWQDEHTLAAAPHWKIWKKKFRQGRP